MSVPLVNVQALKSGDRRALARAITLVESASRRDEEDAARLLESLGEVRPADWRLGVSGAPGVGKSTFIEAFGLVAIERGRKVAVITVDPSSRTSGGSILGDKTRMERLSRSPSAFIRSSPARGELGGVAQRTRDVIRLVEAAGYDLVVVETVGVGQSEVAVGGMTDMFVMLLAPGGGDGLQGIKRGIMELADLVVVNKADGDLAGQARHMTADFRSALSLMRPRHDFWTTGVVPCSALEGEGLDEVWRAVSSWFDAAAGRLGALRREQAAAALRHEAAQLALARLMAEGSDAAAREDLDEAVASGRISLRAAARRLVDGAGHRPGC